jgi:malonate-semialdehyde dehydrogenase (acetylating)/methylmalonate-semialdehyde dehydrogenase
MGRAILQNYINGKWVDAENIGMLDIENPSTGEKLAKVPLSNEAEVNRAVKAASAAFPSWSQTPVTQRAEYMYDLLEILKKNEEQISRTITKEMGKSLPDSRAEVKRCLQNLEVACSVPMLLQSEKLIGAAKSIDGEVLNLPIGVFAAITPFNFPAMAPFWFLPYAIATGNTFVLKPSELVPVTMEMITEFIDQIKLPSGVYNLVNGDKVAGQALINHSGVSGISYVGRSTICRTVAEQCASMGKRFQAMGSAKNHLVVMPDYTHMDDLIRNMSTSCYGCAGQRCMASSVIVAIGDKMYEQVCANFVEDSKKFVVGNPLDPKIEDEPTLMGPVISAKAKQFIHDMIDKGIKEGAKLALDGRNIKIPGCEKGHFIGPTVFIDVKTDMEIYKTEIFAPVVCILKAKSLDEAIGMINSHQYSNGSSLYTQNGYYARKFKLEVQTGMVGINVGIPAPVPFFPFGGMKNSMLCDIKMQAKSALRFFTHDKVIVERYWDEK